MTAGQRRAEAIQKLYDLACKVAYRDDGWGQLQEEMGKLYDTARREALGDAVKVCRDWPWEDPSVYADPLRQARCKGNREASTDIADALDRLREGVEA